MFTVGCNRDKSAHVELLFFTTHASGAHTSRARVSARLLRRSSQRAAPTPSRSTRRSARCRQADRRAASRAAGTTPRRRDGGSSRSRRRQNLRRPCFRQGVHAHDVEHERRAHSLFGVLSGHCFLLGRRGPHRQATKKTSLGRRFGSICITGLMVPLGAGIATLWNGLAGGHRACSLAPLFMMRNSIAKTAGSVKQDPSI